MKLKTKVINFRADEDRISLLHEARTFFFPDGTLADLINKALNDVITPIMDDLERIRKFRDKIPATKPAGKKKPRINGTAKATSNKRRKAHA